MASVVISVVIMCRDGDRRDFRRDNQRRDFHRYCRISVRKARSAANSTREEKMEYREAKRGEYLSKPRRNSDGTISFPSQNPYTHRRPGEPKMPKGIEWSMLSTDDRERLRGLSKEHAENIGLHILAAYTLEERDPELALEHAKWVAHQASRIDFARETLAFVAYRQGDYKLALREFRTAFRMNGFLDYLPFIADCERGMGEPKKAGAIETAMSDDAKYLRGESKAEMFLVYAGALGDLELWDKAIEIVHTLGRSKVWPANTACVRCRPNSTSSSRPDAPMRPWPSTSCLTSLSCSTPMPKRTRPPTIWSSNTTCRN